MCYPVKDNLGSQQIPTGINVRRHWPENSVWFSECVTLLLEK